MITFGSLFSGIEGFGLGMERAGMSCAFQIERDPQCLSVLGRHWPDIPKFTDVREFNATSITVRPALLSGGFPCQDLSVAGRRAGLAGDRSGLFFEFMRIVGEFAPRWVLIENVPGLLSSNGGRDMGTVLWTLGKLGYGWAYRVLDAQWFGVPQRRRRVFIVGCVGDFRRSAEVLFERESLPWDSPPSREAGKRVARCLTRGPDSGSRFDGDTENFVAATLNSAGHDGGFRTEPGEHLIPIDMRQASRGELMTNNRREGTSGGAPGTGIGEDGDPCPTLAHSHVPAIAFSGKDHGADAGQLAPTLRAMGHESSHANGGGQVAIAYQCHGSNVGPMGTLRQGNGNETGGVPFTFTQRTRDGHANVECSDISYCLDAPVDGGRKKGGVVSGMAVRRLTPRECERLQGFPDDWTRYGADGKEISDSARYRMCGNAVAVPVAAWIGRRIVAALEQVP